MCRPRVLRLSLCYLIGHEVLYYIASSFSLHGCDTIGNDAQKHISDISLSVFTVLQPSRKISIHLG
ncbi:MAG: hypothetical protein HNEKOMLI_00456 [Sodalis sp. Psp]|nr:hypothetical protein [Sodalis sp. Psp]MCR3756932.1 hypothetical protein [Sodalis sp. Ppy]